MGHSSTTTLRGTRLRSLDILRALAIFLVIGSHVTQAPESAAPFLSRVTFYWRQGGWVGVDLFFVLSGFLISGLLFREYQSTGRISPWRFFVRRAFKIYPAFYAFLLLSVVFRFRPPASSLREVFNEVFFLQNYDWGLWGHTWSLAVEEHFYLILPFLLIALARGKKNDEPFRGLPTVIALLAVLCFILRVFVMLKLHPYSYFTHFRPTHLRIDSLFFGVLISYFYHYARPHYDRAQRYFRNAFPWIGALLFLPAFLMPLPGSFFITTVGLTMFYLGSGMLLMAFLERESLFQGKLAGAAAFIGSRSYSIYIWHVYAVHLCDPVLKLSDSWPAYWLACFIVPVAVGILAAWSIEYPMLKLRDSLFKTKTGAEALTS